MRRAIVNRGFTLIELLVVISIIALLIAILLPTMGAARETGRSVTCLSNLRQMSVALAAYTSSNDDQFVSSQFFDATSNVMHTWEISTLAGPPVRHVPGLLWQDGGTLAINQCPSFDGPDSWVDSPYTGYNYNTSYLGRGQGEAIEAPARVDEVRDPVNCAAFGDAERPGGGSNKFMRAPLTSPGDALLGNAARINGAQGFRHLSMSSTNVAYVDGHAASRSERFTAGLTGLPDHVGFLSPDNAAYDLE